MHLKSTWIMVIDLTLQEELMNSWCSSCRESATDDSKAASATKTLFGDLG